MGALEILLAIAKEAAMAAKENQEKLFQSGDAIRVEKMRTEVKTRTMLLAIRHW